LLGLLRAFSPELASRAEVGILLVNDRQMRRLNHLYRGIDRTTDVLSFPIFDRREWSPKNRKVFCGNRELKRNSSLPVTGSATIMSKGYPLLPLGDIVINLQAARRQSHLYDQTFKEEVRRLLIHGLLHLLGYDHEESAYQERKMRKKERELHDALETLG